MDNESNQKTAEKEMFFSDHMKYDILASSIAHDLNNILATISGYAEMLQEDLPEDSPLKEKTEKILTGVLRARSLTNQILMFSGQVKQEKIPVNVNDILMETVGFVRCSLPPEIRLNSDIPKTRISVFADPTQLFRIFFNLMTNAIQSMEEKGGTLSVGVRLINGDQVKSLINREILADDYVIVTFKDTGPGIDVSLMQRIFEPFFTTRKEGKGTGLGLTVVHGIVSDLEGEILISSKEHEGSVFDVYLPVLKELGVNDRLCSNH